MSTLSELIRRPICIVGLVLAGLPSFSSAQIKSPESPNTLPQKLEAGNVLRDEPVSALGRRVLDKARPSVVQIKSFFEDNTEKSSHGSGFVVGAGGLAITNYHVVSDSVMYPEKYRMEYRTPEGKKGKVTLLAIDVIHDVSLVQLEGHDAPALPLAALVPAKGERAYSVGYPLDVGLTITEGVSNGLVEESYGERLHYSGAINGGMSGGPAMDAQGRVIGVNVSTYMFQQSVAFLVPATHAAKLLTNAQQTPNSVLVIKEARKEVTRQLTTHANTLLAGLPAVLPTQTIKGVSLPTKLSTYFDCGASGNPDADNPVQTQRSRCAAKAGLYVNGQVYAGDVNFNHQLFSTTKLDALRFAKYMQMYTFRDTNMRGFSRKEYGPQTCESRVIKNNGIDMFSQLCSRAYRKFDGLFDISLRIISSYKAHEGFMSELSLSGVPFDPAIAFAERYLSAVKLGASK